MISPSVDEYNEYAIKKNRITKLLENREVICDEIAIKKIPTRSEIAMINMYFFLFGVFFYQHPLDNQKLRLKKQLEIKIL